MLRLSVAYALTDGSHTIEVEHLWAAHALWSYAEATVRHVFGDRTGDEVADKLLAALRVAGDEGLDGTEQGAVFGRHVTRPRLDLARQRLEQLGLATRETVQTNGRPRVVMVASKAKEANKGEGLYSPSSLYSQRREARVILDPDRAEALHLAVALDLHRQTCRTNGVFLPAALDQLGAWCWRRAKGDSEGQTGPTLAEIVRTFQTPSVMLTYAQAAQWLKVSTRTLKRMVTAGEIPTVTVGGSVRIRRADLEHYIASLGPRPLRDRIESKSAVEAVPAARRQGAAARRHSPTASSPTGPA